MIRVTMCYTDITSQMASQVRLERAAAKNPKAPPVITGAARLQRLDLDRRGGRVPALERRHPQQDAWTRQLRFLPVASCAGSPRRWRR